MVEQADQEGRRVLIAEAVLRIAGEEGLEAASVRAVAAEAGVSVGMVQHHFGSKNRMLLFALGHMNGRIRERARARAAASAETGSPREEVRAALADLLPLDGARRAGIRAWLAFLARAAVDPELAAPIREMWAEGHAFVAGQLRRGKEGGGVPQDLDCGREALALYSLVDGLVSHILVGLCTNGEALSVLDRQLARLFGGAGPHE